MYPESDNSSDTASYRLYSNFADIINDLRGESDSPVVLLGAFDQAQASPRIAVNLAIALVRCHCLNVLLVEAAHSRSDLSSVFELPSEPGFFEWRRGLGWASKLAIKTSLDQLAFMPAGHPSEAQHLGLEDISKERHRWANLRRNYDIILLYSPEALAHEDNNHAKASEGLLDLADAIFALTRTPNKQMSHAAIPDRHKKKFLGQIMLM